MTESFAVEVLAWFDVHGRHDLPWQASRNPYPVWISEIMLQQTQVATVIPYYDRFMARFTTVVDLANADLDEVLSLWTGLGYYARARNLHRTARIIRDHYNGAFPESVESLNALPGIGRSTAGAIASICFGINAAILDGNVKRVLARCFAISGWPGQTQTAKALWEKAEALQPGTRFGDYTQAMMDLGATVCTRTKPSCQLCPVKTDCRAFTEGNISAYPGKKPKTVKPTRLIYMLLTKTSANEFRLVRRPEQGIWGGLYSFPEYDEASIETLLQSLPSQPTRLPTLQHSFTHYHLTIVPLLLLVTDQKQLPSLDREVWITRAEQQDFGLSRPAQKLLDSAP